MPAKQPPGYTLAQVAQHASPADCWVVVHGQVYDVSAFVPRHPGGALIYVKAGGDCSHLFDSYHPASARCGPRAAAGLGGRFEAAGSGGVVGALRA